AERHGHHPAHELPLAARLGPFPFRWNRNRALDFDLTRFLDANSSPATDQVRGPASLENDLPCALAPAYRADQSGADDDRRYAIDENGHHRLGEGACRPDAPAGPLRCQRGIAP